MLHPIASRARLACGIGHRHSAREDPQNGREVTRVPREIVSRFEGSDCGLVGSPVGREGHVIHADWTHKVEERFRKARVRSQARLAAAGL